MLELSDRKWADFQVGDIFDFTRGKRITTAFASANPGNIPVIAGGEQNNGILCYLDETCKTTRVLKDSCISVAAYGTAGCVHYHGYKCFIDDKAIALNISNNKYDNKQVNLFMVAILSTLQSRYSYGRGVTVDRYSGEVIQLPVDDNGQPDYDFMEQYIVEREPDYSWATGYIEPNAEISLSDREWAEFKVKDLFNVSGTKTTKSGVKESGKYPYLTTQATNNSVNGYTDFATEKGNCIVAESACIGYSSYQETDFTASDHVEKLTPYSQRFNKYIVLFINTMLRKATEGKYNYGHKFNQGRIRETIISLPITADGTPDYYFMEQYIKSLPFSKVLE